MLHVSIKFPVLVRQDTLLALMLEYAPTCMSEVMCNILRNN